MRQDQELLSTDAGPMLLEPCGLKVVGRGPLIAPCKCGSGRRGHPEMSSGVAEGGPGQLSSDRPQCASCPWCECQRRRESQWSALSALSSNQSPKSETVDNFVAVKKRQNSTEFNNFQQAWAIWLKRNPLKIGRLQRSRRPPWAQGVGGSNPLAPTNPINHLQAASFG